MIELKNIVKEYGDKTNIVKALKGVSMNFRNSEFVSILGPSGCGKTTLLNIIGGLDKYTSGDIIINGKSTKDFKDKEWDAYRNHYIGFVFQSYNLISHLSILENVEVALSIAGVNRKEKRRRAIAALKEVGLIDQIKKKPNQLSGGQMQRVAIARAIVNEPEIILADEPTGALDSETSVQVMEILKKISKKYLVIMVTHNESLAVKYSDRIINMLDGEIIGDSKEYTPRAKKKDDVKIKSSMSLGTAFGLSFKNLFSKKWKTAITSFAGSIGIIGIALVVSVSNGFTNYINHMQSDTLAGYPIAVSNVAVNYDGVNEMFMGNKGENGNKVDDKLNVFDSTKAMSKLGHFNYIDTDFLTYLKNFYNEDLEKKPEKRLINSMEIKYSNDLKILTKDSENIVKKLDTGTSISSIYGTANSLFFEGLENEDFVLDSYDVVAGEYPKNKNELAFIVDSKNNYSKQMLDKMFIKTTEKDGNFEPIAYADLLNKEYKLVLNNDYYIPEGEGASLTFKEETNLDSLYNKPTTENLKITCVLKIKESAPVELFGQGIMYLPSLANFITESNNSSLIAVKSKENNKFYKPYTLNVSELQQIGMGTGEMKVDNPVLLKSSLKTILNIDLSLEKCVDLGLQSVGASSVPIGIYIYPKSFDGKEEITNYINAWNEDKSHNKIIYTDATELLTNTMGQMIDIVSYVLIAFSAISLIVSSIMIGVITYTSVIERRKEIGIIRAIGGRKKDISRIFNAETFMIGTLAGLLGVGVAFILTFPISALIIHLAGGVITTPMAILKWDNALILTGISMLLTLIAGLIPARIASKKDPVQALRSE